MNQNKRSSIGLFQILLIGLLVSVFSNASFAKTAYAPLLKPNEQNIFSFRVEKSSKIMTIAISHNPDYLVYRFGTADRIELEFPQAKPDAWDKFAYSWYSRGGGPQNCAMDLNYLTFTNHGYTYTVFQVYTTEDETYEVGIQITNEATKQTIEIYGDSTNTIGTLTRLRANEKIDIVEIGT